VGDEGAVAFARALESNPKLVRLRLKSTLIVNSETMTRFAYMSQTQTLAMSARKHWEPLCSSTRP
jgi:hypothetical protein